MTHTQTAAASGARTMRANEVRRLDGCTDGVVLHDGSMALIDREVRLRLIEAGHVGTWFLNDNGSGLPYVRLHGVNNLVTVARLVVGAAPNEQVEYVNGNRCDLRSRNLRKVPRRGGKRKDIVSHAANLYPTDPDRQAAYLKGYSKAQRDLGGLPVAALLRRPSAVPVAHQ